MSQQSLSDFLRSPRPHFTPGQRVECIPTGEVFLVMQADRDSLLVRDHNGNEYDALHETFQGVE